MAYGKSPSKMNHQDPPKKKQKKKDKELPQLGGKGSFGYALANKKPEKVKKAEYFKGPKKELAVYKAPTQMESTKQEKKNLLTENPVDDKGSALAMKGSWMSKHCKSALHMGHKDSPAKKHCV